MCGVRCGAISAGVRTARTIIHHTWGATDTYCTYSALTDSLAYNKRSHTRTHHSRTRERQCKKQQVNNVRAADPEGARKIATTTACLCRPITMGEP